MLKYISTLALIIFSSGVILSQHPMGCQNFKSLMCSKSHEKSLMPDTRSDSIDILHMDLYFDFFEIDGELNANASIQIEALVDDVQDIRLDLLDLEIDSVWIGGESVSFDYDGELLRLDFESALNTGDSEEIRVFYQGMPQTDSGGFGGFYFSGQFAYNIGVGFVADPHNFGRAWFPCFDNFVERFTVDFDVLTDSEHKAVCNGEELETEVVGTDSLLFHWTMNEGIPSYLVAMAVGEFDPLEWEFISINGSTIPVLLAAVPEDSADVEGSFEHLENAFDSFESYYGEYRWNKVGFAFVPFNSGAMEHATNIAYPRSLTNGLLTYETLMAHELSHHWWGDLITCSTAEDMWINEGMASFLGVFVSNGFIWRRSLPGSCENQS